MHRTVILEQHAELNAPMRQDDRPASSTGFPQGTKLTLVWRLTSLDAHSLMTSQLRSTHMPARA